MAINPSQGGPVPEYRFIMNFPSHILSSAEQAIRKIDINNYRERGMAALGDDYRDFEVLGKANGGIEIRAYPGNEKTLRESLYRYFLTVQFGHEPDMGPEW